MKCIQLEQKVKEDVIDLSKFFGEFLDLKRITPNEVVSGHDLDTSYSPLEKTIYLSDQDMDNGWSYFEEIGHMYRFELHKTKRKIPFIWKKWNGSIHTQEFVGKLMRKAGNLAIESNNNMKNRFTNLFNQQDEDIIQSMETINRKLEPFEEFRKIYFQELQNLARDRKILSEGRKLIDKIYEIKGPLGIKEPEEVYNMCKRELKRSCQKTRPLIEEYDTSLKSSYNTLLAWKNFLDSVNGLIESPRKLFEGFDICSPELDSLDEGLSHPSFLVHDELALSRLPQEEKLYLKNSFDHLRGYVAADSFLKEMPLTRDVARKIMLSSDSTLDRDYVFSSHINKVVSNYVRLLGFDKAPFNLIANRI